ncbi:hypothetical protein [Daejeonella sp.]|uniref:hypothetical protein n=1 Tax=Daejeonella sp. TaxID=2805397 RepID=UPI0030C3257F
METITSLKRNLLYGKLELKEALSIFKDLGNVIDCPFISAWATTELAGYPSAHDLAEYRRYSKIYHVNFKKDSDIYNDFPVPYESLFPEDSDGRWTYYRGPVTGIYEEYRLEDGGSNESADEVKPQIHDFLTELFGPEIVIIGALEFISSRVIRKIILASEEIMINFLVNLEARFGPEPNIEVLKLYEDDIQWLFLEALTETGRADHLDLRIKYKPLDLEGYYGALFELYDDCGVSDEEQDKSLDFIDQQRASVTGADNLGQAIEDYIIKMAENYPKLGYKGNKLKKAIIAYYGLDKNELKSGF